MSITVIQPENSSDPLEYLVMVPYESGLDACCEAADVRSQLDPNSDGPISHDHATFQVVTGRSMNLQTRPIKVLQPQLPPRH